MKPISIKNIIQDTIDIKNKMLNDAVLLKTIEEVAELIVAAYQKNGKVLLCGNGGSAADAQHLAAELTGRFQIERVPLYAEALHTNSSYLTAVANDYGFENVYSRIISSNSISGDVLIALSTSGQSKNIINACKTAKEKGLTSIAMTGAGGGMLKGICDYHIAVPSDNTARVQECHILIGHIICAYVELMLFGEI